MAMRDGADSTALGLGDGGSDGLDAGGEGEVRTKEGALACGGALLYSQRTSSFGWARVELRPSRLRRFYISTPKTWFVNTITNSTCQPVNEACRHGRENRGFLAGLRQSGQATMASVRPEAGLGWRDASVKQP